MALANGEEARELIHAQAHIWNHIFNFINSMSLKCAVQLGIPDIIHNHGNKPMTLSELVAALPIHASKTRHVYRLMRILVNSGFFALQNVSENGPDNKGYVPTTASRLLLKDDPLSVAPVLLAMLDPILTTPWNYLSNWFQNEDQTPFVTAHGRTIWDYAENEPKLNHLINEAMASDARLVMTVVIDKCKGVFEGLDSLVDVGGGIGTVAKALADAFPCLECISFDQPHVVADLQGCKNLKYVGGDMFEAIPPADAILLKWILHDWSDEECVKILQKCKQTIISSKNKGGKVIILETVMMENQKGDQEAIETQLFLDMLMMVLATGRERNEQEWAKLFKDAGFRTYKITPILGLRSLIEVYP